MKVILIAAISLDGYITRHDEPGSGFTSKSDKAYLRDALAGFDCCIAGAENYRVSRTWMLERLAPGTLRVILTRQPAEFAHDASPGAVEFTSAPPETIVSNLEQRGCKRCALLGGGRIYSLFLEAGCVDELWVTLEARLFGSGTPFCPGRLDIALERMSQEALDANTLLLKYRPRRGSA